jgi:protein-S-isoprenylcysteine O-methyltransferase Ste14
MTGHDEIATRHRGAVQLLGAVASLVVGSAFLGLWFWLLPRWLGFRVDFAGLAPWRFLAALPAAMGFAVALRCIWDFGWSGSGTPAPIAPPQKLVVVGFYRHVRNPMYVGFAVGWVGLWILFGRIDWAAVAWAAVAAIVVGLFVRLYEEPVLRRKFGTDYNEYVRNVPRWMPRLRPWNRT